MQPRVTKGTDDRGGAHHATLQLPPPLHCQLDQLTTRIEAHTWPSPIHLELLRLLPAG